MGQLRPTRPRRPDSALAGFQAHQEEAHAKKRKKMEVLEILYLLVNEFLLSSTSMKTQQMLKKNFYICGRTLNGYVLTESFYINVDFFFAGLSD